MRWRDSGEARPLPTEMSRKKTRGTATDVKTSTALARLVLVSR
jgi:hypothetical protein